MKTVRSGFTIIELLVVIVVIGILAAITVTAYGNIQNRAYASKVASATLAYEKAFRLYKVDTGNYPSTTTCLGDISQYPAEGEFAAGECYIRTNTSGTKIETLRTLNTTTANALKGYMNSWPDIKHPTSTLMYSSEGFQIRGIFYNATDWYGPLIMYTVNGDQYCKDKNYQSDVNVTYCYVDMRNGN